MIRLELSKHPLLFGLMASQGWWSPSNQMPIIEYSGQEYEIDYFDIDTFTFQTREQFLSWEKRLKQGLGTGKLFQHQFINANQNIDMQLMLETADKMIRSGENNPFNVGQYLNHR